MWIDSIKNRAALLSCILMVSSCHPAQTPAQPLLPSPEGEQEQTPSPQPIRPVVKPSPAKSIKTPHPKSRPVLFLHGFAEFSFYFNPLIKKMEGDGFESLYKVAFWPNTGDIVEQSSHLAEEIDRVRRETGAEKVNLVAHSMGGLVARHYIKFRSGGRYVESLVTLATPHHGTMVAWLPPTQGARQMRPDSDFLKELNEGDLTPGGVNYTSIYSNTDEIVIPNRNAELPGAQNYLVPLQEHLLMMYHDQTYRHLMEGLGIEDS